METGGANATENWRVGGDDNGNKKETEVRT